MKSRHEIVSFRILPWVTISLALKVNSESLSAMHWYNVTPRVCLKNNWRWYKRKFEIKKKTTNNFDVRFVVCGVGVVRNDEDELPIGSNFDDVDERLFVNDKRFGCSDGIGFE